MIATKWIEKLSRQIISKQINFILKSTRCRRRRLSTLEIVKIFSRRCWQKKLIFAIKYALKWLQSSNKRRHCSIVIVINFRVHRKSHKIHAIIMRWSLLCTMSMKKLISPIIYQWNTINLPSLSLSLSLAIDRRIQLSKFTLWVISLATWRCSDICWLHIFFIFSGLLEH